MWKRFYLLLFVFGLLLFCCGASLQWNASIVDSEHAAPTGYRIHRGPAPGVYDWQIDVGNVLQWPIPDDLYGEYYWSASAYNASGSSGYSNEVYFTRNAPPDPPQYVGAVNLRASKLQWDGLMAITRTSKHQSNSASNFGSGAYTTSSFTASSGSLLLVAAYAIENGGTTDPSGDLSISDSLGLTWTSRAVIGSTNPWSKGLRCWTAPSGSGGSMTVSIDCGSRTIWCYNVVILELTGHNADSPIGATATDSSMAVEGSDTLTLSAAPAESSYVFGILGINSLTGSAETDHVAPGSGWTELYDNGNYYTGIQIQERTGSTSATVTWSNMDDGGYFATDIIGISIEIVASGGGSSAVPKIMLLQDHFSGGIH